MVDYEDELELLTVLAVAPTDNEGNAHLDFYDNQTGTLIKSVPIKEPWDIVSMTSNELPDLMVCFFGTLVKVYKQSCQTCSTPPTELHCHVTLDGKHFLNQK